MKCRFTAIIFLIFLFGSTAYGQRALVRGKLVRESTGSGFGDVKVSLPGLNAFSNTDGEGNFSIADVPYGAQKLVVSGYKVKADTISVTVDRAVIDLGLIRVRQSDNAVAPESIQIPTIGLEDNNLAVHDEGVTSQNSSGLMVANTDPFVSTVAFVFGNYWFKPRGYQRNAQEIQVNGIAINDVETGNASWGQLGGLNDVFHGRNVNYGLTASDYTFGGVNGSSYIDATALDQRKETRVSYTSANRNYRNRLMLTHSSGLQRNGWAYSISVSRRWAREGYVPGTFYDGYSYYAGVSKVLKKGTLNFITFGSPMVRGKSSAAIKEVYELAGTNYYNHNWGYQNGRKRNFNVQDVYQPVAILNYEYKPSERTRWNTAVGYQTGKDKNSSWAYYNAYNPVGDYYKNLPSNYLNFEPADKVAAAAVRQQLINNPEQLQFDWDGFYQQNYMNYETINNVNGIAGNMVTGRRSLYAISNRVTDLKKFVFNTNIGHHLTDHVSLHGGVTFVKQKAEHYQEMADLLGGDFFLNLNQFAEEQAVGNPAFLQHNVNMPNTIVKVGDKWNYDYALHSTNGLAWGQTEFTFKKVDLFAAASAGYVSFNREGFFRNGLYPANSFGNSKTTSFLTYSAKGGFTFKIDPRNFIFANAGYFASAPNAEDTYISPEKRDHTIDDPTVQLTKSVEAGYLMKSYYVNARIGGYATDINNITDIKRFFNDDPAFQNFVNFVLKGVNTRSLGTEIAVEVKAMPVLSITAIAAVGQAFYTNRPDFYVYSDNDTVTKAAPQKTYIKNYYLAAGPQSAYTLGLNYHPGYRTFFNVNFNFLDRNYVEINPNRRTITAAGLVDVNTAEWNAIFNQEKLPSVFTVDIRAGKTIHLDKYVKGLRRVSNKNDLSVSAGISNLLNNTNVINSGFEQPRYDFARFNPQKFPNKYIFGPGVNYFINVSLTF